MPVDLDQARPLQLGQVLGDGRLRQAQDADQLSDIQRIVSEQPQDPQAILLSKDPQTFCQQIHIAILEYVD
jgi:hypothetical protein